MMKALLLAVIVFASGACTDDDAGEGIDGRSVAAELCPMGCTPEVAEIVDAPTRWEQLADRVFVSVADGAIDADPCSLLPTEGLCALACSPELVEHIPPGTCIDLRCELSDGRTIVAGGCALP